MFLFRERGTELENLRAQVRENPALRPLISALRSRLSIEDAVVKDVESLLRKAFDEIVATLRGLEGDERKGALTRRSILTASLADIAKLLDPVVDAARLRTEAALVDLLTTNEALARTAAGLPAGTLGIRTTALDAFIGGAAQDFWQSKVAMPAAAVIADALRANLTGETLDTAIDRMAKQLDTTAGKAATEVRTNVATFDRLTAEESAQQVGLDLRIYTGPLDALTRPFCKLVINKAWSLDLVKELDNGQTGPGIWGGGGYNCRHRWAAVRPAIADELGYPMATMDDVRAANAAGAR